MAIRIQSGGLEYLSRTTGLLNYNAAYTRAGFFYMAADANDYGHIFASEQNPGAFQNYDHCGVTGNGTTFRCEVYNGGSGASDDAIATLAVGNWYFIGMRRASATSFNAFVIPLSTMVLDVSSTITTNVAARTAISHMWVNKLGSYVCDGRYAGLKEWSVYLTDAELLQEAMSLLPRKLDSLHAWYPMLPGSGERTRDYGGGGYDWTEAGTLSDEDHPPVSWGAPSIWLPYAASGVTGSAAVTEAADTASASGAVQVSGSAAATEAADTSSASATVDVSGSAAVTEAADTSAATGAVDISGSAAVTEAADTSAASGTVSGGAATGTADVTEADDSVAASGTVDVSGSAAVTEADDTTSASGVVGIEAEARPSGYGNWNDLPVWNKRRRPRSARRGRVITVREFLRAERERSERRTRVELERELEQARLEELEAAPAVPDPAPRISADLAPVARLVASADNRRKKREEQQGIADEDLTLYAAMLLVAINGG